MAEQRNKEDENDLVVRSYHGDKEAFGKLYEKYLVDIFRYIYYRIANEADAEDLTEIVFLNAWEALPRVDLKKIRFKPWIYKIAHNKVIDEYRTAHTMVSLEDQILRADHDADPENRYQENELNSSLAKAISHLDPTMQDVIIYRFILGLSHEETAEIMNRSVVNIRVLQFRALGRLREWYQGEERQNG